MQLGAMPGHPADQPDVDFVVAMQPGEPAVVGGHTARRNDVVVTTAEHVVSGPVGDVQQVGQPQPGGAGDRSQRRGCGIRTGSATRFAETIAGSSRANGRMKGRRHVRADNTPKIRFAASRPPVLHRLTACGGAHVVPWCGARLPSSRLPRRWRAARPAARSPAGVGDTVGQRQRRATAPAPSAVSLSPAGVTTKHRRARALDRRGVLPGLPRGEDMDAGPPGRPAGAGRGVPGGGSGAGRRRCRHLERRLGRLPLARQAGVIVAAKAAANDECG